MSHKTKLVLEIFSIIEILNLEQRGTKINPSSLLGFKPQFQLRASVLHYAC